MKSRATRWLLASSLSGIIIGTLDSLALCLDGANMFFNFSEMFRAMVFATALCGAGGTLLGFGCLGISAAMAQVPSRWQNWGVSLLFSPLFILLFWLLTRGPQASAIPGRIVIVGVLGFISAAFVGVVATKLLKTQNRNLQLIIACTSMLIALFLVLADIRVLVRLYLPFHAALSLFAWVLTAFSVHLLWKGRHVHQWHIKTAQISTPIILMAGLLSLFQIRQTQNIRFVIGEKTATASDLVLLAKTVYPPPVETQLDTLPLADVHTAAPSERAGSLKLPGASILLITVDAMRYDRLNPGKMDNIAPTINRLGAEGVIFDRAYTALPHTSYAVASFITGKYIKPLFDIPEVTADQETWPEIMRRFRYRTGGFFTRSVFFVDRAKFKPLENKGYGFGYLKMEYRFTAEQKVNQALEFLEKVHHLNAPAFTWVHLFEPHEPYKKECTLFGSEDEQRYDCEIHTADMQIKRLIDYVDEFYPNTIVILAADHGEEFNDHGGKYHGTTLYDEQVRVPLVMRVPGVAHRIVREPVSLVDVMGTVLSIVDIPVPPRVRSRDLSGLLIGSDTERKTAFSQLHERRMAVYNNHKLIWDKSSDLMRLYDLKNDPDEKISIADKHPETVQKLKQKIVEWEAAHAQTELRPVTTGEGVQSWPAAVQKALGGDESITPQLLGYLTDKTPKIVRQKAAELLFDRWTSNLPEIPFDSVDDPVCLAWLWSAVAKARPDEAVEQLTTLSPRLEQLSSPWVRAQLSRLGAKDATAIPNVMEIARTKTLTPAIRIEAIQLLGDSGAGQAEDTLLTLLTEYLLRQHAARALAKLKSTSAMPPIVAYLKNEPFVSRRSELAAVLAQIGGAKITDEIAIQMADEKPIPNGLTLLNSMRAISGRPTRIKDKNTGRHIMFVRGNSLSIDQNKAMHLFVQVAENQPSIVLKCNGKQFYELKDVPANTLQTAPLTGCAGEKDAISFSSIPTSDVEILMLAVW